MDCGTFLRDYSDYDDSLLSAAEMEAFRRHLDACASCARYDRVLRKGRMVVRQSPPPAPSESFLPDLQRRLWVDAPGSPVRVRRSGPGRVSGVPGLGRVTPPMVAGGAMTAAVAAMLVLVADPGAVTPGRGAAGSAQATPTSPTAPTVAQPATATAGDRPGSLHFHSDDPTAGRALALPSAASAPAGGWSAPRVDHSGTSTYSPLVTGPPAYRATGIAITGPSPPMTLD